VVAGDPVSSRDVTYVVWAVLGAVVVATQVAAVTGIGRLPGVAAVTGRAAAGRVARSVLVVGWMWLGWHAFAR
jgi:hypothetical protein